jgi:chemotaxis methyl-accepting protein methylase
LHPEEFAHLFNTILINVTGFYRDPATWDYLAQEIVPQLVAQRPPDAPSASGARAWRRAKRPTPWCSSASSASRRSATA